MSALKAYASPQIKRAAYWATLFWFLDRRSALDGARHQAFTSLDVSKPREADYEHRPGRGFGSTRGCRTESNIRKRDLILSPAKIHRHRRPAEGYPSRKKGAERPRATRPRSRRHGQAEVGELRARRIEAAPNRHFAGIVNRRVKKGKPGVETGGFVDDVARTGQKERNLRARTARNLVCVTSSSSAAVAGDRIRTERDTEIRAWTRPITSEAAVIIVQNRFLSGAVEASEVKNNARVCSRHRSGDNKDARRIPCFIRASPFKIRRGRRLKSTK